MHTDRHKWPVAKQWEQTFVKAVVSEISIKDRIQSQKVVSITSSLKRVIQKVGLWLTRASTMKKIDSAKIWGSKWILLRVIERACALHPRIRGVSASSIMATIK